MKITGTKSNETLTGTAQNDIIKGGKGDDVLIGGLGSDVMRGGKGADIFVVNYGDTILDFQPGKDKIFIDQPVLGQLYQDATGIYAGYDAINNHPTDLIVKVVGFDDIGGSDLLGF